MIQWSAKRLPILGGLAEPQPLSVVPPLTLANDPLGVLPFREFYIRALEIRFNRLASLLRTSIVKNEAFGLAIENQDTGPRAGSAALPSQFFGVGDTPAVSLEGYVRRTSDIVITEDDADRADVYWAIAVNRTYRSAVAAAIEQSPTSILSPATVLRLPDHQEALAILRQRQLNLLKGVTDTMARDLRDVTARGIAKGLTKTPLAAEITSHVTGIPFTRAQTIAATQITDVYAEATLNAFHTIGVTQVKARVEFTLNVHGFAEPCPRCVALAGVVFGISEARGVIPVHPRCQCGWFPAVQQAGA
jgi:hypothetical protein